MAGQVTGDAQGQSAAVTQQVRPVTRDDGRECSVVPSGNERAELDVGLPQQQRRGDVAR